jgi:uncharacterized protein YjbI with pentapeptide repeats
MNDAPDEPSQPTSAEPQVREISDEELQRILADHKRWLTAESKHISGHGRADLSGVDLRRQDAILRAAELQEANLERAQLQRARLNHAQLQRARLSHAGLQEADLFYAQLQEADLSAAQLQEADLSAAQLQGADLSAAQLQGANLPHAQLQGAYLWAAQLREAHLETANFEQLAVTEDGKPGQARSADLTNADFRDADLSNARLSTVTGLRAEKLGGAVLTNAKLPDDVARFDQLTHVAETSRNAITVFFGLLAASLYSWLTIATTTDVALITGTASSPLPIINTNIALSGFYLAAPLILLAVYFYFHLYLQRLWSDLASLPAVFPDGVELDRKAYPWLLNGLVRKHFKKLELAQRPLTRVENVVSILLAWWVVPFTLLAFWLRFLPRHDWLGTSLQVVLIAVATWFGVHSYQLAVRTLRRATAMDEEKGGGPKPPLQVRMWRSIGRYRPGGMEAAGFGVGIVMALSLDAAIRPGTDWLTALGSGLGYETYAELTDEDISTKPSEWTGRDETAAVEIAQVKGADLEDMDLRNAEARGAFLVKARLQGADLRGSYLLRADLREAQLAGLREAQSEASIAVADLRGAYLIGANLSGANLSHGKLRGVNLVGANLSRADLVGANLSRARLITANLSGANLSSANLSGADLRGANLSRARLDDANLSGANLRNHPTFRRVGGAINVTRAQLDVACGDEKTRLPHGLTIRTCPDTAPPPSPSPPPGSS